MKILILSQHYWPESFRINDVAEALRKRGVEIEVLTGQPNYPEGNIYAGYFAGTIAQTEHPNGYTIVRVPVIPRGNGSAARLAINYVSFILSSCTFGWFLLRAKRFDIIFVYGLSPILQGIAGVLLKRQVHAALITWVQDLWPQSLLSTGFVRNRILLALVEKIVRWIYQRNDLLLVQSPAFLSSVQSMAGATPVIYHPNASDFTPRASSLDATALNLGDGFTVVFAGNLGTVQALETVLDAAEILRTEINIRFILIGSGSREAWLRSEVKQRSLKNVEMPGRFSFEAMPGIYAQASALLVSLVRDPVLSLTIPSKVQAYLAAGRPIIAALDGEGARVVLDANAGVACPAEDAAALAQAVLSLRNSSPQVLEKMGDAGRDYHARHFSPTLLTERLIGHFRDVVARRPRWSAVN